MQQTGRIYSLIVGDKKASWEINSLHITFDVNKFADNRNQDNTCVIEIYNLSRDKQSYLEKEYISAVLSVGYKEMGLVSLYAGQVLEASTRKSGADTVTTLRLGTSYTVLNHKVMSKIVPDGEKVEDVIKEIAKALGTSKNVITGVNCKNPVIDGYPLTGTPKEMLNEVCKAHKMEWSIDNNTLYVRDIHKAHTRSIIILNQSSGLIERPFAVTEPAGKSKEDKGKVSKGIQVKCLINPSLVAGGRVRLEYENLSGDYRIDSYRANGEIFGNNWYMDLLLRRIGG